MRSFLPAVAEQLIRDIQKVYRETTQIPDDLLIATFLVFLKVGLHVVSIDPPPAGPAVFSIFGGRLKFVFGSCASQALDLVDHRSVTCLSSPSGRKAFQVIGGSGRLYTCFLSCHYCPCPSFTYTVLRRNQGLLCKHILAIYLCQAMAVTQQETVSDQQMSALLSGTGAQ